MTDGIDIVSVNREKRDTGNFTIEDVAEYLQKKAKPDAKVYPLKIDQWVKVGQHQLYVKSLSGDMDDSWIHVIVKQDSPWLNWIVLPFARLFMSSLVEVNPSGPVQSNLYGFVPPLTERFILPTGSGESPTSTFVPDKTSWAGSVIITCRFLNAPLESVTVTL